MYGQIKVFPENCFLSYLCTLGYRYIVLTKGVYTEGTVFIKSVVLRYSNIRKSVPDHIASSFKVLDDDLSSKRGNYVHSK